MYKIKYNGRCNIIGKNMKKIREEKFPTWSQRIFAEKLQLNGLDVGKNRISEIELGKSYVNDIELKIISKVLLVSVDELLDETVYEETKRISSKNLYDKDSGNVVKLDVAEK